MSSHSPCKCGRKRGDHRDLVVLTRNGNRSAFNGYHWTYSEYSQVMCTREGCVGTWRTKASYVHSLPDAPEQGASK